MNFHPYADNNHCFLTFCSCESKQAREDMDILNWMHFFRLNDNKKESLLLESGQQLMNADLQNISIGDANNNISASARNIGAVCDLTT